MKSKAFKDIVGLCLPYKGELITNFLLNVVNAVLSLFTFLSVVPFYTSYSKSMGKSHPLLNILFGIKWKGR
jgi:heme O synthase-like polyprenyltransferase